MSVKEQTIPLLDLGDFIADSKTVKEQTIPLLDLGDFIADSKNKFAENLVSAFSTFGFVYLKNFGACIKKRDKIFSLSKKFFQKPIEYKLKYQWESPESNRGYVPLGREKLTELDKENRIDEIIALKLKTPDLKETLEIGSFHKEGGNMWKNRIPDDLEDFKEFAEEFFLEMHNVNMKIITALNLGLNLPDGYLQEYFTDADNNMRLLHYPSVEKSLMKDSSSIRAGEHCDYGSITLLFQDEQGGLEVKDYKTGKFIPAPPIKDTIIVNIGDMLQRWSNDRLKSTLHRVVRPVDTNPEETMYPERYSLAYFCNPNFEKMIDVLSTCYDENNPKKYKAIKYVDHLTQRLANRFGIFEM